MKKLFREPKIKNKYDLNEKRMNSLVVLDRNRLKDYGFFYNPIINAWYYYDFVGESRLYADNEFWIGIYDETFEKRCNMTKREIKERTNLNNKIRFKFTYYGTDCEYRIKTFYDARRILNECDLEIQEKFIDLMNQLIDEKIIGWENPC